jgi:hypothetical protein
VSKGSEKEKAMLTAILRDNASVRGIEPLIRLTADENDKIRKFADRALRHIAATNSLEELPDTASHKAWRIWWIKLCRCRVVKDSSTRKIVVTIISPDKMEYFAASKLAIVPKVIVYKAEQRFMKEAKVELIYDGKTYKIKPVK